MSHPNYQSGRLVHVNAICILMLLRLCDLYGKVFVYYFSGIVLDFGSEYIGRGAHGLEGDFVGCAKRLVLSKGRSSVFPEEQGKLIGTCAACCRTGHSQAVAEFQRRCGQSCGIRQGLCYLDSKVFIYYFSGLVLYFGSQYIGGCTLGLECDLACGTEVLILCKGRGTVFTEGQSVLVRTCAAGSGTGHSETAAEFQRRCGQSCGICQRFCYLDGEVLIHDLSGLVLDFGSEYVGRCALRFEGDLAGGTEILILCKCGSTALFEEQSVLIWAGTACCGCINGY